jgi:hypothetical protein
MVRASTIAQTTIDANLVKISNLSPHCASNYERTSQQCTYQLRNESTYSQDHPHAPSLSPSFTYLPSTHCRASFVPSNLRDRARHEVEVSSLDALNGITHEQLSGSHAKNCAWKVCLRANVRHKCSAAVSSFNWVS